MGYLNGNYDWNAGHWSGNNIDKKCIFYVFRLLTGKGYKMFRVNICTDVPSVNWLGIDLYYIIPLHTEFSRGSVPTPYLT